MKMLLLLSVVVFLVGGCCCGKPFPKRDIPDTGFAVIWPSMNPEFISNNYASVTKIDGIQVAYPPLGGPVRIKPGKNLVEVDYYTDSSPLVGYYFLFYYPVFFYKTYDVLELTAQPGHDYVALADEECDRSWIWIEDRGLYNPAYYTESWGSLTTEKTGEPVSRAPNHKPGPVVAGERPDTGGCPDKAKETHQQD